MDYGAHGAYIFTAYGASIAVIGALIFWRLRELRKAEAAEKEPARKAGA
jgi:heme exporter protein CcmD